MIFAIDELNTYTFFKTGYCPLELIKCVMENTILTL